jgi:nucleoside-diphosphate-sugar epimerase
MGYVHIDDVASAHILAYEDPAAKGRYICSSVVLEVEELAKWLATRYPDLPIPLA